MRIRSVSPLIATIILIALTVAIGAIIVGWGRSYVQQQTSCLGYEVVIEDATVNVTSKTITLKIRNTGEVPIRQNLTEVYFYNINGNRYRIPSTNIFLFDEINNMNNVILVGSSGRINANFTGITSCNDVLEVEVGIMRCGIITNKYPIQRCVS